MSHPKTTDKKDGASFGRGADRRLARAVLDASHAAGRATQGSPRAEMLEGLRTAAAGVAAALASTRGVGYAKKESSAARRKKTTTALLVACGGLEEAIRAVVPAPRRAHPIGPAGERSDESAA